MTDLKNGFNRVEILLAEDSPTQAEELKHTLERQGIRVTVAANGNEALALLGRHRPTLVISDIVMPGMDGYQLCRRIKEDGELKSLPVILLTSLSDPRDVLKGLECGADNFLTKPYDERCLLSRIQYLLANVQLRETERTQLGLEVVLAGERHFIKSDRIQILNLLLSSYEAAIQRNSQLTTAQEELRQFNEKLEQKVKKRTAALMAEVAERKRAEKEIRRLNEQLEERVSERTAQLQAANQELEREVAERRRAEERLQHSENGLKGAQRLAQLGNWELDLVHDALTWSDEIYRIFEIDPGEFDASYEAFLDAVHPEDRGAVTRAFAESVKSRTAYDIVHRLVMKDGRVKEVHEHGETFYDGSGRPLRSIGTVQDITERKRAEEIRIMNEELELRVSERTAQLEQANCELQALNDRLENQRRETEQAKYQAVAANRAKSDFLANMSHELRTPLTAVIGFSEVLLDGLYGQLNEKQSNYVGNIESSGRHLLCLINDILDLSKVEVGKMDLESSRFLLREALGSAMGMLREKAMKNGINMTLEVEPAAEREIEADARKLKQILFNLLSNAVKFTPEGGSVRVSARMAGGVGAIHELPLPADAEFIEIAVEDTGIGIRAEDMGKLFTPFQQLESGFTRRFEGTGLGLALTRRLVELHGGVIRAESTFGKGSRFTFVIPVRK